VQAFFGQGRGVNFLDFVQTALYCNPVLSDDDDTVRYMPHCFCTKFVCYMLTRSEFFHCD